MVKKIDITFGLEIVFDYNRTHNFFQLNLYFFLASFFFANCLTTYLYGFNIFYCLFSLRVWFLLFIQLFITNVTYAIIKSIKILVLFWNSFKYIKKRFIFQRDLFQIWQRNFLILQPTLTSSTVIKHVSLLFLQNEQSPKDTSLIIYLHR